MIDIDKNNKTIFSQVKFMIIPPFHKNFVVKVFIILTLQKIKNYHTSLGLNFQIKSFLLFKKRLAFLFLYDLKLKKEFYIYKST